MLLDNTGLSLASIENNPNIFYAELLDIWIISTENSDTIRWKLSWYDPHFLKLRAYKMQRKYLRGKSREGGPEKLVGGFSYSLTIVLLIIVRSFALCTEVASSSGSRHCTTCTVIWYGEKKNIESRLFFRSLWKWREMCKCLCSSPTSSSPCPCLCPRMSVD